MGQIYSITCGLPFCRTTKGEQTTSSVCLRTGAIALGLIAAIGGTLILVGTPMISQLGSTVGLVALSTGISIGGVGILFQYVKREIPDPTRPENSTSENPTSQQPDTTSKEEDANPITQEIPTSESSTSHQQEITPNEEDVLSEHQEQEGVSVSEETIRKIQSFLQELSQGKKVEGARRYPCQENHRVFSLDEVPNLIFKMGLNDDLSMKKRYQAICKANAVCKTHQLGLLVIPKAKLFPITIEGRECQILAEEMLDINFYESAQEKYYEDYAESLNEAVRQLALFICKTRYSDVEWRNNPVLNNSLDSSGHRKLALIDLEEMEDAETGLFGGGYRRGLVNCVTEQQGQMVKEIAEKNGISISYFSVALSKRKIELEKNKLLKDYYLRRNLKNGDEQIDIDIESIDFSPYAAAKVSKLKDLAKDLIAKINDSTSNSSAQESLKGRRHVYIDINNDSRFSKSCKLIEPGENVFKTARAFKSDQEYYDATFLGCVVKKFAEMELIHSYTHNGHGYILQA